MLLLELTWGQLREEFDHVPCGNLYRERVQNADTLHMGAALGGFGSCGIFNAFSLSLVLLVFLVGGFLAPWLM